jgi:predicted Rossmann fold nucleotide-binding protein DprA/Smf involved in DNA uptake
MGIMTHKPKRQNPDNHPPSTASEDPRVASVLQLLDWRGQSAAALATQLRWSLQDTLVGLLLAENRGLARRVADGDWVRFQDRQ